jgi:soluble cytochrome b562
VKVSGVTEAPVSTEDQTARLRLLNDALKYRTRAEVDTVGELTTLGQAVDAFMTLAAQAADSASSVTAEQWQTHAHALGITGIDTNAEDGNLAEVQAAIHGKGVETIDSISKLREIVREVNASLEVIAAYAENSTNPAPTVANYMQAGITATGGAALVTSENLAAINSAIDRLSRDDVSSRRSIKTVVNAYNAILTAADGEDLNSSGASLTAMGYLAIGVPVGGAAIGMGRLVIQSDGARIFEDVDQAKLALFNNVVGSRNKQDVDTPAKLEALAKTVADLIRTGREQDTDAVVNAGGTALSLDSLRNLGLTGIDTPVRRTAFLNAVKYKGNRVDTATGEPKTGDADSHNVEGINTLAKLKQIAASYKTILDHVGTGESAAAPTREDYLNIGVQLPVHGGQHALQLFNSAIAAQASENKIDDIGKLNKLALTVDKLMQVAAVTKVADKYPDQYPEVAIALEADALASLGLQRMTEASVALLLAKLQTTADDGSDATRIATLQSMADAAVAAQEKITKYARDNSGTAPAIADFTALGLSWPASTQSPDPYLTAINDGGLSAANGVYQLMTSDQVRALPAFHTGFSIDNNNDIDASRPVYRMSTATGEIWYIWSALNGDYRISRQNGSDEWYREILNSPKPTAYPEGIVSGMAMNAAFATVRNELSNNGSSTHQRALTRLAGIQHQSKINHQNIYTVPKPIVTDIAATSSASEIRISLIRSDNLTDLLPRVHVGCAHGPQRAVDRWQVRGGHGRDQAQGGWRAVILLDWFRLQR